MKLSQAGISKYLREGSVRRLACLEFTLFGAVGQKVVNFTYLALFGKDFKWETMV